LLAAVWIAPACLHAYYEKKYERRTTTFMKAYQSVDWDCLYNVAPERLIKSDHEVLRFVGRDRLWDKFGYPKSRPREVEPEDVALDRYLRARVDDSGGPPVEQDGEKLWAYFEILLSTPEAEFEAFRIWVWSRHYSVTRGMEMAEEVLSRTRPGPDDVARQTYIGSTIFWDARSYYAAHGDHTRAWVFGCLWGPVSGGCGTCDSAYARRQRINLGTDAFHAAISWPLCLAVLVFLVGRYGLLCALVLGARRSAHGA
jgi:hypothetical protein